MSDVIPDVPPELQRQVTTIRLTREGRVWDTFTFGRTACCHGASTPLVISCSPGGQLLQLSGENVNDGDNPAAEGYQPRDELRTLRGGPVVRRRLSFPDQDSTQDRPWPRPRPAFIRHNGLWISETDWLLLTDAGRLYRGEYVHLKAELLPDLATLGALCPGPDRSWAVQASGGEDWEPGDYPDIVCCDADCELLWTVAGVDVEAAVADSSPFVGFITFALDSDGLPVIGWSAEKVLAIPPLSLAGLGTDGSLRWQSRCEAPWPDADAFADAVSVSVFRESTGDFAAGPDGRIAALSVRGILVNYGEDVPSEQFNATWLSIWDRDGGQLWSRAITDWSPIEIGPVFQGNDPWLLWDDDRLYLGSWPTERAGSIEENWTVLCVDAANGDALWSRTIRSRGPFAGRDTSFVFPFNLTVPPGGGVIVGCRPFFPRPGLRRP